MFYIVLSNKFICDGMKLVYTDQRITLVVIHYVVLLPKIVNIMWFSTLIKCDRIRQLPLSIKRCLHGQMMIQ